MYTFSHRASGPQPDLGSWSISSSNRQPVLAKQSGELFSCVKKSIPSDSLFRGPILVSLVLVKLGASSSIPWRNSIKNNNKWSWQAEEPPLLPSLFDPLLVFKQGTCMWCCGVAGRGKGVCLHYEWELESSTEIFNVAHAYLFRKLEMKKESKNSEAQNLWLFHNIMVFFWVEWLMWDDLWALWSRLGYL